MTAIVPNYFGFETTLTEIVPMLRSAGFTPDTVNGHDGIWLTTWKSEGGWTASVLTNANGSAVSFFVTR